MVIKKMNSFEFRERLLDNLLVEYDNSTVRNSINRYTEISPKRLSVLQLNLASLQFAAILNYRNVLEVRINALKIEIEQNKRSKK